MVCISESDACGVDALQVILGCSIGKGNLLFHVRGKSAYSIYNRKTGKSVRLVLRAKPEGMTREESFAYYQACDPKDMFDVKETTIALPEKARLFDSYVCECCGEVTGANWIRISGGKDTPLVIECNIVARIGTSVFDLAKAVQSAVKTSVESTTGLVVEQVNVNIGGISLQREAKK